VAVIKDNLDVRAIAAREVAWLRTWGLQPADLDDAQQEAAIGALRAMDKLRDGYTPSERQAYVAKGARSAALEYLRKRGRHVKREVIVDCTADAPWLPMAPAPDAVAQANATAARVGAALDAGLARLTPTQRALVLHRLGVQALPYDVASLPSGTRGQYLHRAHLKMLVASEETGCVDLLNADGLAALLRN
jgi:DNA-directed RNA polymerase specialized sigma24 family protein